jgi:diphthine-ammonia ligase
METDKKYITSWSGGKDSFYAFLLAMKTGLKPVCLLNVMNENNLVSRSHAIPKEILLQQAAALNLPLLAIPSSWDNYEENFIVGLTELKLQHKATHAVFGDIDLQPHKDWEEKVCNSSSLIALLPLWKRNRKELVLEMLHTGIETYIVSCNNQMGSYFLGKKITAGLLQELAEAGVDVCGENGEYHTLVVNGPYFKTSLTVKFGEKHQYNNYWFVKMN